jgi:hypothetical protein
MAAFKVLRDFTVTSAMPVKMVAPGATYISEDVISGLTAAEAAELLQLAPAGTFEAFDAEARTVTDWLARKIAAGEIALPEEAPDPNPNIKRIHVSGSVGAAGDLKTDKE